MRLNNTQLIAVNKKSYSALRSLLLIRSKMVLYTSCIDPGSCPRMSLMSSTSRASSSSSKISLTQRKPPCALRVIVSRTSEAISWDPRESYESSLCLIYNSISDKVISTVNQIVFTWSRLKILSMSPVVRDNSKNRIQGQWFWQLLRIFPKTCFSVASSSMRQSIMTKSNGDLWPRSGSSDEKSSSQNASGGRFEDKSGFPRNPLTSRLR